MIIPKVTKLYLYLCICLRVHESMHQSSSVCNNYICVVIFLCSIVSAVL